MVEHRPPDVKSRHSSQLHVMHVVPGLLLGGMELTMARVISGLQSGEMRHSVICLKADADIADRLPPGVDIHCMRARPNELQLPLRMARVIRQARPTVIHARNWGAWPDTLAAGLFVWPRIPVILSFHGLGKADFMPWRRRAASSLLARMAGALFTVSQASKNLMVDRWGWPSSKTAVIPNGVDTDLFAPGQRCGGQGKVVVGTVGNLRPVKNQALLLEACRGLIAEGHDLEIRIAGEGGERSNLLALADSLGISDRLQLAGRVEDVAKFLRELDVFVLPSNSEQHPNALNEAMACGLACVATRVGSVEELLDSGRSGRVVPPGDVTLLCDALAELIADKMLRKRLGELARIRACERYSLTKMLRTYETLYCRVSRRETVAV